MGLPGVVRGRKHRTTAPGAVEDRPMDIVNRNFDASRPNQLWVAGFTLVATWKGFAYVAFGIDVFSRMVVGLVGCFATCSSRRPGWRVAAFMSADLTLAALEQTLWAREVSDGLGHHSDRGSQYLAIRHSERLAEAGRESLGSGNVQSPTHSDRAACNTNWSQRPKAGRDFSHKSRRSRSFLQLGGRRTEQR